MRVELITTGSELLLGQIVNTNGVYMATHLNDLGFDVLYQTTVGDNHDRMRAVIENALARVDIVITTGGLGPTQGDITKYVCAEITGCKMVQDAVSKKRLDDFFQRKAVSMSPNNLRQVLVPEGARVFINYNGLAPGAAQEYNDKLLINLPGPPREMKDMFIKSLIPFLKEKFGIAHVIHSLVLNTYAIGESLLETKIRDLILAQKNPTLALLARPEGVIVRITAKADDLAQAEMLIAPVKKEIYSRVGEYIYATDDEAMEEVVGKLLNAKKLTVSCAESCTGGLLTSRLTDVAGSSAYVSGSIITYTNCVKKEKVAVPQEVLLKEGAVSAITAKYMAEGVAKALKTDIGVSVTGVAGPDPSENKPVGLVYIAVHGERGTFVTKNMFSGKRKEIKYRASQEALNMLRLYLLDKSIE